MSTKKMNKLEIYKIIKLVRELQGITQRQAAIAAGIDPSNFAKYEKGRTKLSIESLIELAKPLNLNPSYIIGESINPFKSNNLIKMILPENLLAQADYSPIEFILSVNQSLEIIYLIKQRKEYVKKLLDRTILANSPYAILVKDSDNNIIIFKRRGHSSFIVGETALQIKLTDIAKREKKKVSFSLEEMSKTLAEKITNWTVEKDDIEHLFKKSLYPLLKDEEKLITTLREQKICPDTALKKLGI